MPRSVESYVHSVVSPVQDDDGLESKKEVPESTKDSHDAKPHIMFWIIFRDLRVYNTGA